MSSKIKIYAYNTGSKSAKLLADALDCYIIKRQGSAYTPRVGHTVINWGKGRIWHPARTLNHPEKVGNAINKRSALNIMSAAGVKVPPSTVGKGQVQEWLDAGHRVLARTILDGCEGEGIVVIKPGESIPNAPLYTKYIPKDREYRVHVMAGAVIDTVRKVLSSNAQSNASKLIRNTANGYVFARREGPAKTPIVVPEVVHSEARKAVAALGLDFGAVDVIWSASKGAHVLEVNTAPGIEGTTVQIYKNKFMELYNLS